MRPVSRSPSNNKASVTGWEPEPRNRDGYGIVTRQTDRQAGRQTGRQTDRTDRQARPGQAGRRTGTYLLRLILICTVLLVL